MQSVMNDLLHQMCQSMLVCVGVAWWVSDSKHEAASAYQLEWARCNITEFVACVGCIPLGLIRCVTSQLSADVKGHSGLQSVFL